MKKTIAVTLTLVLVLFNFAAVPTAFADEAPQATVELRGIVIDETNAYIAAAPVTLDDGKGNKYNAVADDTGRYRFTGVKPGLYTLAVELEGFARFEQQVDLTRRQTSLDIQLKVGIAEQVDVKSDAAGLSTEPDKNLSAITLTEKDLEALPDDPDELLNTLKQMAGAGADDAQVYVGGFRERGQLPPKEAIQRIVINSNPFSAEFSEPGHSRIEIITKPGSNNLRGGFHFTFNDEALNARDPYAISKEPFQYRRYGGNLNGPIVRNRAGFFLDFFRNEFDDNEIVNALVLNPVTLQPEPFITTVVVPQRSFNFSVRTDILLTKKHTIGAQYRRAQSESLRGSGGFNLPERTSASSSSEDTLRFSLTTIATEHAVNEMRFQLSRRNFESRPETEGLSITVLDAFSGGSSQQLSDNLNRNLDFTNNLTYTYKKHTLKAGIRAEGVNLQNLSLSNFGGTFLFGRDFERNAQGQIVTDIAGAPISISPLELYRRVLLNEPGYRPTQFSINRGDPFIGLTQWEYGWFLQDDWKVSQKLTLSYGFRHEFQKNLQDRINFAPRFGLAWNPSGNVQKGVVRAGAGVFYNRLDTGITSETIRLDGFHQQQFVIQQPGFFGSIPDDLSGATRVRPTIRIKAEDLNAPYNIQATVGYERQLTKTIFGSATYSWIRGIHLLRSRNINAPIEFTDNNQPVFPFPGEGPILLYEATGLSTRNQLQLNMRWMRNPGFMLFANYTLAKTNNNVDGSGSIPANNYDLSNEWGRASYDVRHRFFVGGNIMLPGQFRINPYIVASSSAPFNITTGSDNNSDNYFTDRPAFANPGDPGAIETRFGTFNPNPRPGDEIIPRNFGDGPGSFTANLGVSRTFGFGTPPGSFPQMTASGGGAQNNQNQQGGQQAQNQNANRGGRDAARAGNRGGSGGGNRGGGAVRGGGGGGPMVMMGGPGGFGARHKYNITLSLNFNNILNHLNPGRYNGVLTSPFFGIANQTGGGGGFGGGGFFGGNNGARRIDASVRFNF